jgi:hypothetical protein
MDKEETTNREPIYELNGKEYFPGTTDYWEIQKQLGISMINATGIPVSDNVGPIGSEGVSFPNYSVSVPSYQEELHRQQLQDMENMTSKKLMDYMKTSPIISTKKSPSSFGSGSGIATAGTKVGPIGPVGHLKTHVESFFAGASARFSTATGMRINLVLERVQTVEGQGINLVLVHDSLRHEAMRVFDESSFPRDFEEMEKEIIEKVMIDGVMNMVARTLKLDVSSI